MDNEDSDVTSAGTTAFLSECGVCGAELEKKSEPSSSPTAFPSTLEILCCKCMIHLAELHEMCSKRSEQLKRCNSKLIAEDIKQSKHLQEVKNSALARIKEFKVVENLNSKLWSVKRDLKDSISVIQAMKVEKEKLCDGLNQKQCLLDEKQKRIHDIENLIRKGEENLSVMDSLDDENRDLLEKIRDFEIDSFLFVREIVEALGFTKNQILKERAAKGIVVVSDVGDLSNLKEIQKSLQEEIFYTRKRIDALSDLLSSSFKSNSDL